MRNGTRATILEIEEHAPNLDRLDGVNRLAHALANPAARPLAHTIDRDRSLKRGVSRWSWIRTAIRSKCMTTTMVTDFATPRGVTKSAIVCPMPETTGALLDRLDAALREQDGFVTTHQAERLGVRRSKLSALVRAGDLQQVMRSVYVLARRKPAPRVDERTYAAWLALDGQRLPWERNEPIVVLSHASAARLHGLGTLPDDVVEMTSPRRRTTTLPAIRLHIAPLDASDWQWAKDRRIMVTTPARTIADLAVSPIERGYVLDALDDAIERHATTREAVIAATARRSPRRVANITRLLVRA